MNKQHLLEQALIKAGKKQLGFVDDTPHEAEIEFYDDGGTATITLIQASETGTDLYVCMSVYDDTGNLVLKDDMVAFSDDDIDERVQGLVNMIPRINSWRTFGL
jgi:hypothetical protein